MLAEDLAGSLISIRKEKTKKVKNSWKKLPTDQ